MLQAALAQFYEMRVPPAEVNLPVEIEDVEAIEEWLSQRAGRRVKILVPQRGDKRALVELATRNAELSYRTRFNEITAAHFEALETLRVVLGLPTLPRRIDCFDISTIQGSETVASMVVCEDGRMKKAEYRKFRVRGSGIGTRDGESRLSGSPMPPIPDPAAEPGARSPKPDASAPTTSPRCARSSAAATARCSRMAGRSPISS